MRLRYLTILAAILGAIIGLSGCSKEEPVGEDTPPA